MMHRTHVLWYRPPALFILSLAIVAFLATSARADLSFLGVAAGDPTSTYALLWTRAVDPGAPAAAALTALVAPNDPTLSSGLLTYAALTDPTKDYTAKVVATDLQPNTRYYYRFVDAANSSNASIVGTFKTAPTASTAAPLRFGFSGDMDGLIRPYALAITLPAQQLDFYINLGDVIYETASNVKGNIGLAYTNSPSVTLSGPAATLNGIPVGGTTFAAAAQLKADYEKKYRENFLPVNLGGQASLQAFYAGQGNFTTWDNHELGNRQYINGGAPAGGSVGGPTGNDMLTGRGVDARAYTPTNAGGSGNVNNLNDVNTSTSDFMNRATGFQILQQVFLSYQPIPDRGTVNSPADPRTDGSKLLYAAQQWGKNAIYINTDSRSYRDLRLKTSNGSADDTSAPRANNPGRTFLGATQLAWLKQTLLDAQNSGTVWKFVSLSDPVDQLGPIGGALAGVTATTMLPYSSNINYAPVSSDGGKSYIGGYRAERNALLKFIADNGIANVVFLSTDDHQNRVNELTYSPTGDTETQSSYTLVPRCIAIVCGPLGATGPDLFLNHDFASLKGSADLIAGAQSAAGLEPIGLEPNYPGLFNVSRIGDPAADTLRQPIDFYSPDTFNYNTLEVSGDGKILTVKTWGINSTAQNSASEYDPTSNPAHEILSFSINAFAPAFTACPADTTVNNDAGQCSALLAFTVAASGVPAPTVTCLLNGTAIASPFHFPKGVNAVTCTAVNSEGTATCGFSVTVKDAEAPVANPVKVIASSDDVYILQATDNCDGSALQIFVKDSAQGSCGGSFVAGPYAPGTRVKFMLTKTTPSIKRGSDDNAATISTVGNPVVVVTDSSGNRSCSQVPVKK
jgi:phosphodiesterase/alkaline phosphatase D-like protein